MNGEPQPTYTPGVLVTDGDFFNTQIELISSSLGEEKITGTLINIGFGNQSNFLRDSTTILGGFSGVTKIIGVDPSGENYIGCEGKIEVH